MENILGGTELQPNWINYQNGKAYTPTFPSPQPYNISLLPLTLFTLVTSRLEFKSTLWSPHYKNPYMWIKLREFLRFINHKLGIPSELWLSYKLGIHSELWLSYKLVIASELRLYKNFQKLSNSRIIEVTQFAQNNTCRIWFSGPVRNENV